MLPNDSLQKEIPSAKYDEWNIKEAINDFNDSLRLHDYSYAKSPIKELQCYVEEMAEKFPILKQD